MRSIVTGMLILGLNLGAPAAFAYPMMVQLLPKSLQGVWVHTASASSRTAACKAYREHKALPKQAYFIHIDDLSLRHDYGGASVTLQANDLINSRIQAHSLSGDTSLELPLIQGKLNPNNHVRTLSYQFQGQTMHTPHLAVKAFYRCRP